MAPRKGMANTVKQEPLRSRKVNNTKILRIYTDEINCIPTEKETGVDKEEEEEWHLVNALKLRTESMEKGTALSGDATIPVPTSSRRISYYADAYQTRKWKKPSTYVKFSLPVEECIGCLYCMDEKDDKWLANYRKKTNSTLTEDQFEEIMQYFENIKKMKSSLFVGNRFPRWQELGCLPDYLLDLKNEASRVYTHWKMKHRERMKKYKMSGPLMCEIKTKEDKNEEACHPWTCFRRRKSKHTRPIRRRTRYTEAASIDKLKKIRKDILSGLQLMVDVIVREKIKKQKIELDCKIFEKKCKVRELIINNKK